MTPDAAAAQPPEDAGQPDDAGRPETAGPPEVARPDPDSGADTSVAYLPIGLVFFVLGLAGMANDTMRPMAFAFFPIGIVFLVLGMQGRNQAAGDDADLATPDQAAPDDPEGDGGLTPR